MAKKRGGKHVPAGGVVAAVTAEFVADEGDGHVYLTGDILAAPAGAVFSAKGKVNPSGIDVSADVGSPFWENLDCFAIGLPGSADVWLEVRTAQGELLYRTATTSLVAV